MKRLPVKFADPSSWRRYHSACVSFSSSASVNFSAPSGKCPQKMIAFTEDEVENESRGAWYVRQMIGAANISGGPFFHVMSGNLSYQVEHHLYPDMPSSRYQQIAPRVKAVCEKYKLPYNTGPLRKQWGSVQRTILRLAFPGGGPRKKPGPYVVPAEEKAARERAKQQVPAFP